MRTLIGAIVWVGSLSLSGCCGSMSRSPTGYVNCVAGTNEVTCTVSHTGGAAPAKFCWDYHVTCNNGTEVSARACETVRTPKGSVLHVLHEHDLRNLNKCNGARSARVDHTTAEAL